MPDEVSISLDRCSVGQVRTLLDLAARSAGDVAHPRSTANLAGTLTELCKAQGRSGELILSTVCDADASVEILRGLKDLAKQLVQDATTAAHRDAATLLYHATIAAAAARHRRNISSLPFEDRIVLYEELAAALAGDPLGGIFCQAVEAAAVVSDPEGADTR